MSALRCELEHLLELVAVGEEVERRLEAALSAAEVALPELLERLALQCRRFELLGAVELGDPLGLLAVDQQVRGTSLAVRLERVLELPFRAGDGCPSIDPAVTLGRQRRAQARPQDHDLDVGARRRLDDVLEVARCEHGLVFPKHRLDLEEAREFAGEPAHDDCRAPALFLDVAGRGDEDPERLCHSVGSSCPSG